MWVLCLELACWQVMVNHHRLYLEGTLSATSPLAMRPKIMTSSTNTKGVAYLNRNQWFRQTHTHNCVLLFIYTTWNVRQKKFTQKLKCHIHLSSSRKYTTPLLPGFLVEGKMMMGFLKQYPRETPKPCSRQAVSADSTLLFCACVGKFTFSHVVQDWSIPPCAFQQLGLNRLRKFITLLLHLVEWFV